MGDSFKYMFRFCCDPGFNDAEEIAALQKFVDVARIDDVMVFVNVQEINTGHITPEEQDVYLEMMRRIQPMLEEKDVTMSINHWHTLMHADMGKHLREGQHFRLMVDPYGREATQCVCPLCEEWQAYLTAVYSRYAEMKPAYLWIEDDFRFHNHSPLAWGGCFCEEHMKLYSEMAGRPLSREEFFTGLLQQGEPHHFRKIWLDACRTTLVRLAQRLGSAVHERSPRTQLALMSSDPRVHCVEGRDWPGILQGLACGNTPVNRTHLPCYIEMAPSAYMMRFNRVSMLTRAFVPKETEIYPELENYPYSRFTKSRAFTKFQLTSAAPLNLSGMTIDLYDLDGNGIMWGEGYQETLAQAKDFMIALTDSGVFRRKPIGVQVLTSPLSSGILHTAEGHAMEELYPGDAFFAALLPAFGIPFAYCCDKDVAGQVVAASGQSLRNLSVEQIERIFLHNYVLLDGDAAYTLFEMGLGRLAGIESARWAEQNGGEYAYEQVCDGKAYCGKYNGRASAMFVCSDALFVQYSGCHKVLSEFHDSFRNTAAPCTVEFGGNVLIWPYGRFGAGLEPPPALLNNIRQALLQGALMEAAGRFAVPPMLEGDPYHFPYCYETDDGFAVFVVNASTDGSEGLHVNLCGRGVNRIHALREGSCAKENVPIRIDGNLLDARIPMEPMECTLLYFYEREEQQSGGV
jgi:hypothetical protein